MRTVALCAIVWTAAVSYEAGKLPWWVKDGAAFIATKVKEFDKSLQSKEW